MNGAALLDRLCHCKLSTIYSFHVCNLLCWLDCFFCICTQSQSRFGFWPWSWRNLWQIEPCHEVGLAEVTWCATNATALFTLFERLCKTHFARWGLGWAEGVSRAHRSYQDAMENPKSTPSCKESLATGVQQARPKLLRQVADVRAKREQTISPPAQTSQNVLFFSRILLEWHNSHPKSAPEMQGMVCKKARAELWRSAEVRRVWSLYNSCVASLPSNCSMSDSISFRYSWRYRHFARTVLKSVSCQNSTGNYL